MYLKTIKIKIFSGLSETQLGAFCDYFVIDGNNVYAEVTIEYRLSVDGRISRTYLHRLLICQLHRTKLIISSMQLNLLSQLAVTRK